MKETWLFSISIKKFDYFLKKNNKEFLLVKIKSKVLFNFRKKM